MEVKEILYSHIFLPAKSFILLLNNFMKLRLTPWNLGFMIHSYTSESFSLSAVLLDTFEL